MKKIFAVTICALVLFVSVLPVFTVKAVTPMYSNLPEPVPTGNCKYFVIQSSSGTYARLLAFYYPYLQDGYEFNVHVSWNSSNSRYNYYCDVTIPPNGSSTTFDYHVGMYGVLNGDYQGSWTRTLGTTYTLSSTYTITSYPYYLSYGCSFAPPAGGASTDISLAPINWQSGIENDLLTKLSSINLTNIENSLTSIYNAVDQIEGYINSLESYTDGIEGYIDQLEGYLDQVESLLTTANTLTTTLTTTLHTDLNTTNTRLNTINTTLTNIYNKCSDIYTMTSNIYNTCNSILNYTISNNDALWRIYALLGGEKPTPTFPNESEASNEVSNYHQAEDSFMDALDEGQSDIDNAFGVVGDAFTSLSNGFNFVKNIFEVFILQINWTYVLVFFTLTFGLITLLIGRKT